MSLQKITSYTQIRGGIPNVMDFGAVGDGTTDDTAAIQAALNLGESIYLPEGTYRVTSTLNISGTGTSLIGAGPKSSTIIADSSVSPVIEVGASTNGYFNVIRDLRVTRAGTSAGASTIGIKWTGWNYGYEERVVSDNHGYCWSFTGPSSSISIASKQSQCAAYNAVTAYYYINALADLFVSQGEMGLNGGELYSPLYCVYMTGHCNDIIFTDTDMIPRGPSSNTITTTLYWADYSDVGVFNFNNCNTENVKYCFGSNNANQQITELKVVSGRWTAATAINNWNSATTLFNVEFIGANFGAAPLVWAPTSEVRMTGCFTEALTVNGGSGGLIGIFSITGCQISGPFTASGQFVSLSLVGNNFLGSYSNTATGEVTVFDSKHTQISNAASGTVYSQTSTNQFIYGAGNAISLLTIKQLADTSSGGFCQIAPNSANYFASRTGSDSNYYFDYNGSSVAKITNSTGAYTALSDERVKKDITDINLGLSEILKLRPVSYKMNQDETDAIHLGFIAQEAQTVIPSSVSEFSNGMLGMDKGEVIAVLVKAIQELKAEIDTLKAGK